MARSSRLAIDRSPSIRGVQPLLKVRKSKPARITAKKSKEIFMTNSTDLAA